MADVAVIYPEDSVQWKDYLIQRLTSHQLKISTQAFTLGEVFPVTDATREPLGLAKCAVVVASPGCLEHLMQHPNYTFSSLPEDASQCLLLLLGVSEKDVRDPEPGVDLSSRFPHYQHWQKASHENPEHILKTVVTIIERVSSELAAAAKTKAVAAVAATAAAAAAAAAPVAVARKQKTPPPTQAKPPTAEPKKVNQAAPRAAPAAGGAHKQSPKGKKLPSPMFDVIPSEVRCETPTTVTISLHKPVAENTKITVVLTGQDNLVIGIRETKRRNPYTYTFRTPVHPEDNVRVSVMLDDPTTSQKHMGVRTVRYESDTESTCSLLQIHINLLQRACAMLKESKMAAAAMDRELCASMDQLMESLSPRTFEQLFGIFALKDIDKSESLTPTLLHLAAMYGLQDLSVKLLDLPDSGLAYNICNSQRKQPAEIASEAGHTDLAQYLSSQQEVNNHMGDIYQDMMGPLYDQCTRDALGRYDAPFKIPIEVGEDHYIIMDSDMERRRMHSSPESIYMDMEGSPPPQDDGDCDDYEHVDEFAKPDIPPIPGYRRSKSLSGTDPRRQGWVQGQEELPEEEGEEEESEVYMELVDVFTIDPMKCPIEIPPETAGMTKSQRELVDIMNQAKKKEITLGDAEKLFQQWQMQHKAPKSFKEKQEGLEKMRRDLQVLQRPAPQRQAAPMTVVTKRKPWAGIFKGSIFGNKNESKRITKTPETKSFGRVPPPGVGGLPPSIPEDGLTESNYLELTGGSSARTSTTSINSSDRGSTLSTDSAYEFDEPSAAIRPGLPPRSPMAVPRADPTKRNSLMDQLQDELNHPSAETPEVPKLPPRLPKTYTGAQRSPSPKHEVTPGDRPAAPPPGGGRPLPMTKPKTGPRPPAHNKAPVVPSRNY